MSNAPKIIDLKTWDRRNTYQWFKDFDYPYFVVGAELDITAALPYFKQQQLSPYLCLIYAACKTANQMPSFRQRMRGTGIHEQVVEHECIHANFTVPKMDSKAENTFAIKLAEYQSDFRKFYASTSDTHALAEINPNETPDVSDHWLFISCLPWVSFTHITQPVTRKSGSIPRIVWGKFTPRGEQILLPISVQAHHSLLDGIHVGQYLQNFQRMLSEPHISFK